MAMETAGTAAKLSEPPCADGSSGAIRSQVGWLRDRSFPVG